MILARVPIYGTQDAGRKFWQRFKKAITDNQFRECKIAKALYVHVDELCWAIKPKFEESLSKILETSIVNEETRAD